MIKLTTKLWLYAFMESFTFESEVTMEEGTMLLVKVFKTILLTLLFKTKYTTGGEPAINSTLYCGTS